MVKTKITGAETVTGLVQTCKNSQHLDQIIIPNNRWLSTTNMGTNQSSLLMISLQLRSGPNNLRKTTRCHRKENVSLVSLVYCYLLVISLNIYIFLGLFLFRSVILKFGILQSVILVYWLAVGLLAISSTSNTVLLVATQVYNFSLNLDYLNLILCQRYVMIHQPLKFVWFKKMFTLCFNEAILLCLFSFLFFYA